jgi:hypothetical protein
MNTLPTEIIINICRYLNSFDLIRFSSVNLEYRNLIKNHQWDIICRVKNACAQNREYTFGLLFSKFKFKKFDLSNLRLENIRLFNDAEYLDLTGNHSLRVNALKDVKCNRIILPEGTLIIDQVNHFSIFSNSIIRNDIINNNVIGYNMIIFESCLIQTKVINSNCDQMGNMIVLNNCYFSEDTFKGISGKCIVLRNCFLTFELLDQFKLCHQVSLNNTKCTIIDYLLIKKYFKCSEYINIIKRMVL